MTKESNKRKYLSVSEYAKILGISRIAVYKKIKNGKLKAIKIGNNYAIAAEDFLNITGENLTNETKNKINKAVEKTFEEYGELLKLLGRE
jgi:excisionase family DNA binding protein